MTFAQIFAATRKARDHTQAQAAAILGVSVPTVQNWESGRCEPHPNSLQSHMAEDYMSGLLDSGATY